MSLRARVLLGMACIAVVLIGAALLVWRSTEADLVAQVDAQLRDADLPIRSNPRSNRPASGDEGPSSLFVAVVLRDGRMFTQYTPNLSGEPVALPDIDAESVQAAPVDEPVTVGSRGSDLRYRVLVRREGPATRLVLALPLDDVDDATRRLLVVEAVAVAVVLGVLALVTWWVIRLGVRPVKQMTATASAIAEGSLSHRVDETDPKTEAGQLGIALNQMLTRIEESFDERTRSEERLRRFVADASHELRTPITTIRGYAELHRGGGLNEPGARDEAMRRTEEEAIRMGALVEDLLHLARLDQGRPMERAPVDLSVLVADAVRDARAVDPGRSVDSRTDPSVVVVGDEGRLRQVVANLMTNALVHTAPASPITVTLGRVDGHAVLEVADAGPGMAATDAARAFERFYRADASRSRHSGGSGLGLAIVEATVRGHGGAVSLDSEPGSGTTVRVELPLADA
jgi:two-component system OmpR family sensor kinase